MTLKQALVKIIELQQKVIELQDQLITKTTTTNVPFISIPYTAPDLCSDGGFHDYPNPWMGTTPAPCKKCGKQAPQMTVTSYASQMNNVGPNKFEV